MSIVATIFSFFMTATLVAGVLGLQSAAPLMGAASQLYLGFALALEMVARANLFPRSALALRSWLQQLAVGFAIFAFLQVSLSDFAPARSLDAGLLIYLTWNIFKQARHAMRFYRQLMSPKSQGLPIMALAKLPENTPNVWMHKATWTQRRHRAHVRRAASIEALALTASTSNL